MIGIYDTDQLIAAFDLKGKNGRRPIRNGTELPCCCPFPHYDELLNEKFEKNPSFSINLVSGKFNCYSCGKKGLTIQDLASRLNIEIPYIKRGFVKEEEIEESEEKLLISNEYLVFLSAYRENAIRYMQTRFIANPEKIVDKYRIGASKNGDVIYFPMLHRNGDLTGWVERITTPTDSRWLNRPDNFSRSDYIYGAFEATGEDRVFLTESVMDTIKLASIGFPAVATLGALISKSQVELIAEYFNDVVILPQNDRSARKWFNDCAKSLFGRVKLFAARIPQQHKDAAAMLDDKLLIESIQKQKLIKQVG